MKTASPPNVRTMYRSFDRAFKVELALFMVFVPVLFTLWIFAAYYYRYTGHISSQLVTSAAFFSIMYFYARMSYANFRRNALGKAVFVETDKIVKKGVHKTIILNFADIRSIRPPRFPLMMNRYMVLESTAKKSLKIPLCVDSGHKMIRRIFGGLEENGLSLEGLADLKRQFYTVSKRLCILQKLRAQYMPNLIRVITIVALLHGMVALIFWQRGLIVMIVWGFFNMLLQAAAYFWTELFHVKKLLGDKPEEKSSAKTLLGGNLEILESFSGYYIMSGLIALLLGMAFGVLITEPM